MENKNIDKNLFVPAKKRDDESDKISRPSRTFLQDVTRSIVRNIPAISSIIILLIIIIMSFAGPSMNDYGFDDQDLSRAKLPPRVAALENISWLGFDGKLEGTYDGDDVEDATKNAYARYSNKEEFIEIEVLDEGDGTNDSAQVKASYAVYEAKGLTDTYFWFGTDGLGRDQWTRVWEGTRISLYIAFLAAIIDLVIGVAYGGISAYYGGRVDNVMQRIIEVLVGIPNLVVVLLMIIVLEPGILSITIALTITGWTGMARIVRGEILKLKNQEFVLASRTLGAPDRKIIIRHLVPNVVGLIIINTMFTIPSAIFFEAFLSFIGLGITPPEASLGSLIESGFETIRIYPYMLLYPAIIISIIMIAFNLLADGLRDAFDPKMRD
ncbi:ABC transporter permease [Bacillaceae bacterium S4-13-58]